MILWNYKLNIYVCRSTSFIYSSKFHFFLFSYLLQRNSPGLSNVVAERKPDTSETLALALQEKVLCILYLSPLLLISFILTVCLFFLRLQFVRPMRAYTVVTQTFVLCQVAALLLLSQQEERHLLEKNVNVALQKKIEELQRNLLQVISCLYFTCLVEILHLLLDDR